jgi:predicted  nucleic acid-binding Zn-ribbon protein
VLHRSPDGAVTCAAEFLARSSTTVDVTGGVATARPTAPFGRDDLVDLQQTVGNRATAQLVVARNTDPPGTGPDPSPPPVSDISWIEGLDPHIQEQIDTFSAAYLAAQKTDAARQKVLDRRTANRVTFMNTMRALFGSDAKTQEHFQAIKPMGNDKSFPLWAHVSTRERLLNVQDELKQQDIPMPNTDVALGLRGDHLHPQGKSAGWFTHATGFAIDWKAYATPHIKSGSLIALFETVTGGSPHMDFKMTVTQRLDLIEKMGQGSATEAESQAFLDRVEAEYTRLKAGSDKFKTDLPETSLKPLREVEAARTAIATGQRKLAQLVRSGKGSKDAVQAVKDEIAAAQKDFAAKKADATAHLKEIFAPWTKKLDGEIATIDRLAAAKGVDLNRLTGDFGFKELDTKLAGLGVKAGSLQKQAAAVAAQVFAVQQQLNTIAARVAAARAWMAAPATAAPPAALADALDALTARLNEAGAALTPLKATLATLAPKAPVDPKPPAAPKPAAITAAQVSALAGQADRVLANTKAAGAKLATVAPALLELTAQIGATTTDIAERRAYRKQKTEELGGGTDRAAQKKGAAEVAALLAQKVQWLRLKEAKNGLETDANNFVFKGPDVRDPGITQLLGMMTGTRGGGFFTPDAESGGAADAKAGRWSYSEGFNLAFAKAMLANGFEWGVAWAGQSDTMHFELVEGRRLLESGGTRALVAGQQLAAQEAKAAQDKKAAEQKAAAGASTP